MSPTTAVAREKKPIAYPDQQWADLIGQMASGNQTSLARLYDQSSRLVFGLVMRILKDRGAAEEITLDTYHQIWRQAQHFDSQRGKPSSWILTIARNRAIDRLRATARARQQQTPLEDVELFLTGTDSPEDTLAIGEQQRIVRHALAQLKFEERQLIEIAFFGGLTHQEISSQLNLPLGTVKTRIRSGMMKLRELLPDA